MASDERIREAVDNAKDLLRMEGITCTTSPEDLKVWFEAETPFEDRTLDDIIGNQLLVIHELVEIEEVKNRGLRIGKRTIVDNLEKVDEAHLEAAKVELMVASVLGDREHIRARLSDIEMWICDETVTPRQKKEYRRLLVEARKLADKASTVGRANDKLRRRKRNN